ncbi:TraR/DksA C4-type zinc finger protein [Patescibacteria group bacterium]|nr:TraR/DksA C4-type zinc finger protein [Patescibacteria group bacterium]
MIPESINQGFGNISTILIFAVVGFICWVFILWGESKKDGFNTQRFLDLSFISLIISGFLTYIIFRIVSWTKIYHPYHVILRIDEELLYSMSIFIFSLFPIYYYRKKYNWSIYRILDIYSLGFSILLLIMSIGRYLISGQREYVILFFTLSVLYLLLIRRRGYRFVSGMVFSVFCFFISASLIIYLKRGGSLLFASILFTIGVVNLYFRGKKNMSKNILPEHFLEKLKNKLINKDKRLSQQQRSLIQNDPYLQQGRATDNAETLDDVLEDTSKNVTDAVLHNMKGVRVQVRKALARINIGKYGKCEVCGKPIDKARLEVYPEATTCIDCATDHSQIEEVKEDEMLEKNL